VWDGCWLSGFTRQKPSTENMFIMIIKRSRVAQLLYRYGKHPMKNVHLLQCWEPVSIGAVGPGAAAQKHQKCRSLCF
jgi:hypothetical protein